MSSSLDKDTTCYLTWGQPLIEPKIVINYLTWIHSLVGPKTLTYCFKNEDIEAIKQDLISVKDFINIFQRIENKSVLSFINSLLKIPELYKNLLTEPLENDFTSSVEAINWLFKTISKSIELSLNVNNVSTWSKEYINNNDCDCETEQFLNQIITFYNLYPHIFKHLNKKQFINSITNFEKNKKKFNQIIKNCSKEHLDTCLKYFNNNKVLMSSIPEDIFFMLEIPESEVVSILLEDICIQYDYQSEYKYYLDLYKNPEMIEIYNNTYSLGLKIFNLLLSNEVIFHTNFDCFQSRIYIFAMKSETNTNYEKHKKICETIKQTMAIQNKFQTILSKDATTIIIPYLLI
jgi:hypothetical protein